MTAAPRSETAVGVLLALLSAASYGTMPVLAHVAYDSGADTQTFLAWRFVLAAVVIWPIVLVRRRPLPRGQLLVKVFVLGGVVYVGQALTYFAAVRYGDVTVIAPVVYTYPLFVVVLAAITRTEALTRTKVAAVLIGVAGAILTVGGSGQAQALGIVLAVAAGLIFSFYFFFSDRLVTPGLAEGSTAVIITAAALVFTALSLGQGDPRSPGTAGGWAATAGIALATVVGILFFLEALRRLRPVATAVVSAAEPVVSVLLSVAVLGERVDLTQGLGLVLVIAAVLLACRPPAGQPALSPLPPG